MRWWRGTCTTWRRCCSCGAWPVARFGTTQTLNPEKHCAQGDALVAGYLHDVAAVLQLRRLSDGGLERELALPGLGSVRDFSGRREHSEAFFTYTDFVTPGSFYR